VKSKTIHKRTRGGQLYFEIILPEILPRFSKLRLELTYKGIKHTGVIPYSLWANKKKLSVPCDLEGKLVRTKTTKYMNYLKTTELVSISV
jgi:hypothetical protein